MPALPVIGDTYRCALRWGHSTGQNAVNVIHITKAASSAAAVATALDTNATANMWGSVTGGASVNQLSITPLDGSSATYLLTVSGAKWTGAGGAGDFSPASAEVLSLRSTFRGRSKRGRIYLPFIGESSITNGSISSGLATTQTAWNTWLAALIASGFFPCIASYKLASQVPVSSILVETLLGTQRRRQGRLRT